MISFSTWMWTGTGNGIMFLFALGDIVVEAALLLCLLKNSIEDSEE